MSFMVTTDDWNSNYGLTLRPCNSCDRVSPRLCGSDDATIIKSRLFVSQSLVGRAREGNGDIASRVAEGATAEDKHTGKAPGILRNTLIKCWRYGSVQSWVSGVSMRAH
jgi:hypothetical protein